MQNKRKTMTLSNRLILFFISFCIMLLFQSFISSYQKKYVLEPLKIQNDNIQSISRFLSNLEHCLLLLESHRWEHGDSVALVASVRENQAQSTEYLCQIPSKLSEVSEHQYLLVNAATITYDTFSQTLNEIISCIQSQNIDAAASLYYEKAVPCGDYILQYTQQLLEQAIQDSQSAYVRLNRLNEKLYTIRNFVSWVSFTLGAMAVISLLILVHSVRVLSQAAQEISIGNLDIPDADESSTDEIGNMARVFNKMKHSMKLQIRLLSEQNELTREKMQLLRSQINPHFLFNTLNVVLYTARQEGAFKTEALLSSMSQLFRYALGNNELEVPLAREIHIVNEFFKLQQARFGDQVNMQFDISPEILPTETMVPSFVLQPLVENAFKHGIAPKEDGGQVTIQIFCQHQTLCIRVTDNGVGMDEETLAQLRNSLKYPSLSGEHIGICNVAARLQLRGGTSFELNSRENVGTSIELCMPLKTTEEEDAINDKDTDCG